MWIYLHSRGLRWTQTALHWRRPAGRNSQTDVWDLDLSRKKFCMFHTPWLQNAVYNYEESRLKVQRALPSIGKDVPGIESTSKKLKLSFLSSRTMHLTILPQKSKHTHPHPHIQSSFSWKHHKTQELSEFFKLAWVIHLYHTHSEAVFSMLAAEQSHLGGLNPDAWISSTEIHSGLDTV